MPKTRFQKEQIVQNIKKIFQQANSTIFAVFSNLKVEKINSLRKELKQQSGNLKIVKKRLVKKALTEFFPKIAQNDYFQEKDKNILGNISITWSLNETTAAKCTKKFAQENENYKILSGILIQQEQGQTHYLSYEEINLLSSLPQRQELLSKTVQTIKSSPYCLINVLQGNIRGLIGVLQNIANSH